MPRARAVGGTMEKNGGWLWKVAQMKRG